MSQKLVKFKFDSTAVEPEAPREVVPSGWYRMIISDGEVVETQKKNGTRIKLTFQHLEGAPAGQTFMDGLNVRNSNKQAEEIGQRQLSGICRAVGVKIMNSVADLFRKPLLVKVGLEGERKDESTGEVYETRNVFKGCKPDEGAGAGLPAGTPNFGAGDPPADAPDQDEHTQADVPADGETGDGVRMFDVTVEEGKDDVTLDVNELAAALQDGMSPDLPAWEHGTAAWATVGELVPELVPSQDQPTAPAKPVKPGKPAAPAKRAPAPPTPPAAPKGAATPPPAAARRMPWANGGKK